MLLNRRGTIFWVSHTATVLGVCVRGVAWWPLAFCYLASCLQYCDLGSFSTSSCVLDKLWKFRGSNSLLHFELHQIFRPLCVKQAWRKHTWTTFGQLSCCPRSVFWLNKICSISWQGGMLCFNVRAGFIEVSYLCTCCAHTELSCQPLQQWLFLQYLHNDCKMSLC